MLTIGADYEYEIKKIDWLIDWKNVCDSLNFAI